MMCTMGGISPAISCSDVAFITSRMSPNASGEKGPYPCVKLWTSIGAGNSLIQVV